VPEPLPPLYTFSAPLLDGRVINLGDFREQVLLIVNTASQCGFTPQLRELESIYRRFRERGFSVLGFPCNQFGGQEPGSAPEIAQFCERNYGITFPLFAKIEVNGRYAPPLYRYLKSQRKGALGLFTGGRIGWNFTKFLIGRCGTVSTRFAPSTRPETLVSKVEALLYRS
jgi:glutathione peroxidase